MGNEMLAKMQGFNRSSDSWQDETNADKSGSVDDVARIYTASTLESLTFPRGENLHGEEYNRTVFFAVDSEFARSGASESFDGFQTSYELRDAVKSTGK